MPKLDNEDAQKATKLSYQEQKVKDSQKRKLQRQVEEIEVEIDNLERQQKTIQSEMADPLIATDFSKLGPLQEDLAAIQTELTKTNEKWEKIMIELENF